MVSGSYKGSSINVNDWLIVGALAVGGYFIYKMVVKPTSEVTNSFSDLTKTGTQVPTTILNVGNDLLSKSGSIVGNGLGIYEDLLKYAREDLSSLQQQIKNNTQSQNNILDKQASVSGVSIPSSKQITDIYSGIGAIDFAGGQGISSTEMTAPTFSSSPSVSTNKLFKDTGVSIKTSGSAKITYQNGKPIINL